MLNCLAARANPKRTTWRRPIADFLYVLVNHYSGMLAPFMVDGELSNAFLEAFAAFPLEVGRTIEFDRLLVKLHRD